jgi:hypothetical protein
MNGIAWLTTRAARAIKGIQSGQVQHYALSFVMGTVALAALFIYWLKR